MKVICRIGFALSVAVTMSGAALAAPAAVNFNEKIVGEVQKPTIDILLTRQNLVAKYNLVLKESFLPKIIDSINQKPF